MSTCIFRACAAASWMTNETYNPVRFMLVHKAVTKALPSSVLPPAMFAPS